MSNKPPIDRVLRNEIDNTISDTMNKRGKDIVVFGNALRSIREFMNGMYYANINLHIANVSSSGIKTSFSDDEELRYTILAEIEGNNLFMFVFYDIYIELMGTTQALMCGSYRAAHRTYRFLIELLIYALDFQLENDDFSDLVIGVSISKLRLNKNTFKMAFANAKHISRARFEERLRFKEKYRSPTISDIANKIFIFSNKPKWNTEEPEVRRSSVKDSLLELYRSLSKYVHISTETTDIMTEYITKRRVEHKSSLYDKNALDNCLEMGYKLLDLILTAYILYLCWFFNHDRVGEFIALTPNPYKDLLDGLIQIPSDSLPISKNMITQALNSVETSYKK